MHTPNASIRSRSDHQSGLPISLLDNLVQLRCGRTPGGYAFESAASMIASLSPAARPATNERPPHPTATAAEHQSHVLRMRLQTLTRLLDDVRADLDDDENRALNEEAARVAGELIAAYGPGGHHIAFDLVANRQDRRSAA